MKNKLLVSLVLVSGWWIMGCTQKTGQLTDTPTTGSIKICADETFKPILEAELDVFHSLYPYAHIEVEYKTETDALNDLFRDSTRLIISSRPLSEKELDFFHSKTFYPKSHELAFDALALIVNPNMVDTLIAVRDFEKILTGSVITWDQLIPDASKDTIRVVFDNKNSSTVRFMLDSICSNNKIANWHTALETNAQVIDYVAEHHNAIGVIGVSWISDRDDPRMLSFLSKIKVLAVSNDKPATASNSFQPFQAYIWNHSYPFTRINYVIVSEPRKGLATGFAAFLISERGQRIILKSGILPATQPYRIIETKDHL
ncbi:MAG: substrate-binding domain-containing protein [Salinivirgaceae bacterium]|nr:substrate-binding domain-containing protein [Salinivirgaceae bacterium]